MTESGSRWPCFPWSIRAALFVLGISAAALVVVLAFDPAVSTAQIQRRDRLSPAAQFVDATYRAFLGRPADQVGLAEYSARYDREGPLAVAVAILSSSEFQAKHPGSGAVAADGDIQAQAAAYVQLYENGVLRPEAQTPVDWPGRVGFVLLLGLTASGLVMLQRVARRGLNGSALHIYVPRGYIVGMFAALSGFWFVNNHALLGTFAPGSLTYAEWLDRLANLALARGLMHIWTPYPQATPMLLVVAESVANAVAAALRSDVWSSYTIFRWLFQAVFLLIPSIVLVSTTYRIGILMSPASAVLGATLVAFSFALIYYGLSSTLVTDPLPVLLSVIGILFLLREKTGWAALAIGLAGSMKLIPLALLVPAFVLARNRRSRWTLLLVPSLVLALVFLPFLLTDSEMFWSPLRWQAGRPPWESWYAFVNWLVGAPHNYPSPTFDDLGVGNSFGWVFWGITPPLTALTTPVPVAPTEWQNVLSAIGVLTSLAALLFARPDSPRSLVRWSMYALAVVFFWSPGWSPQYELYLLPLAALAFEAPAAVLGAALALQIPTFLEYPLFLQWAYFYGGSAVWLAWASTIARYLVLGWLAYSVLRNEASSDALVARVRGALRSVASGRPGLARVGSASVALMLALLVLPGTSHGQALTSDGCGPGRAPAPAVGGASGDLDWSVPGGWFFTQAGNAPRTGFAIVDDADAQMWSEFNRLGGARVLGFPASQRFVWHGLLSQATQRAVLEWSPITSQVEFANVLDLMHDDGRDDDLLLQKQIPPPVDLDEAGLPYETIAAHRLAWLESRPAIKASYCSAPGGADPIQLWGLPTSQAVNMAADGGEVYVLRTQRAAFQEWVEGADWAAPGEITVVLAGDLAKEFNLLPPQAVVPEAAHDLGVAPRID